MFIGVFEIDVVYFVLYKLVMNPPYAHTLVFLLAVAGLVGCVGRFDYNLVLALGWLYLGDLNPQITSSVGVTAILSLVSSYASGLNSCRWHDNHPFFWKRRAFYLPLHANLGDRYKVRYCSSVRPTLLRE